MATKKKSPVKRGSKKKKANAERWRKVIGVMFVLLSLYLMIAFVSYIYTWKYDQDKVLRFTWASFFQSDLSVENWLGRLGAYVSNAFFYWGFGIPSILFTVLSLRFGFDLIRRRPLKPVLIWARNAVAIIAFLSLSFEFAFRDSEFAWGGAFGESTCFWLVNFVGNIGLFFLLFFTLGALLMYKFNPSLDNLTFATNVGAFKLPFKDKLTGLVKKGGELLDTEDYDFDNVDEDVRSNKGTAQTDESSKQEKVIKDSVLDFKIDNRAVSKKTRTQKEAPHLEMEIEGNVAEVETKSDAPKVETIPLTDEINLGQASSLTDVIIEKTVDDVLNQEPYDPTLDLSSYVHPPLELLESYEDGNVQIDRAELEKNKDQIIETLLNYKIQIIKIRATIGPTVTLYEIVPAPGVKISKIKNLEDDIALSLAALGIRIIAPIPGKGTIGIEVPNRNKSTVSLKEVLMSEKFQNSKMALPIALGKTISNEVFVADLAKMPHLLIAGATGQGKSVGINTVLMSLLYKKHPSQVKLVLVDPKKVELFPYSSLDKHFLSFMPDEEESILTETSKVVHTLNALCIEMDDRYDLLKTARTRNIKEYNEKFVARKLNPKDGHKFMPYLVLVIDEFADLIMTAGKEIEMPIARLAQLARAIGIHLIIATQRPSVNIITGMIKANFPARIAFKVASKIDSRTILDAGGAEQLIGRGDMLLSVGSSVVRLQCAFVDTPEVERVLEHISNQQGFPEPFYLPEFTGDDGAGGNEGIQLSDLDSMFNEAAALVISNQHGSTSMLQRKLQLGYNRAGRIMDQMEKLGIVGPAKGSKPREVLYFSMDEFENLMNNIS